MRRINYFFLSGMVLISLGLVSCENQETAKKSPPCHTESPSPDNHNGQTPHKAPPAQSPQGKETSNETMAAFEENLGSESCECCEK